MSVKKIGYRWVRSLLAAVLLLAGLPGLSGPAAVAHADSLRIVLNSCDAAGLIDAINVADTHPGADTIALQAGCTYTLTDVDNQATTTDDPLNNQWGPDGLP